MIERCVQVNECKSVMSMLLKLSRNCETLIIAQNTTSQYRMVDYKKTHIDVVRHMQSIRRDMAAWVFDVERDNA